MDYELVSRGWQLNLDKIDNRYDYDSYFVTAETMSKARNKIWKLIKDEDMTRNGEDIIFINVPVLLCSTYNHYLFEGKSMTLNLIKVTLAERERVAELDSILTNESIRFCYITKRGSYYGPNHGGYYSQVEKAGIYTKKEAVSSARHCSDIVIVPIDIEAHNALLQSRISELGLKLILIEEKDIKWYSPDKYDGKGSFKQHAFEKDKNDYAASLCTISGKRMRMVNESEFKILFDELVGEKEVSDGCKNCKNILNQSNIT